MARARAVETRLERLIPAVDEFFTSGFLTKEELLDLTRTRAHWEYRLVAKPLLVLDVRNAVRFELDLEERLRQYCQRTKVNLKHRWSILERIEYIYEVGVKHLKSKADREEVRKEFVLFLKSFNRLGALSKLYGRLMIMYPTRSDLWIEAALWEGVERRNMDHGRAIVQQALVTMSAEPAVWATALRLELEFTRRLLEGVLGEHGAVLRKKRAAGATRATEQDDPVPLSATLRRENAAMAELMLDLALPKAVVEEAFGSSASGPELLQQLLAVCGEYSFAKEAVLAAVDGAVGKAYDVLVRGVSVHTTAAAAAAMGTRKRPASTAPVTQRERSRWAGAGLAHVLRSFLLVEHLCTGGYTAPVTDAAAFLDGEAAREAAGEERRRVEASPVRRRFAATASLAALLTFAGLPPAVREGLGGGCPSSLVWSEVVLAGAVDLFATLAATASPEAVSRVCLSLMSRPPDVAPLDEKAVRRVLETLLSDSAAESPSAGAARKAEREALEEDYMQPAQARVRALVALAGVEGGQARPSLVSGRQAAADGEGATSDGGWPSHLLGRFLTAADRRALATGPTHSTPCGGLTGEDVDRLLLWCRAEEQQARSEGAASAMAAARVRIRAAVWALLSRFGLVREAGVGAGPASAGDHPLLETVNALTYTDPATTPLCVWRIFNALEVVEGAAMLAEEAARPPPSPSSSDSDADEETGGAGAGTGRLGRCFDSYAAAGAHFLATAPHGSLDRQGQLDRAVGLSALARSRLRSVTGLRLAGLTAREDLLAWLTARSSEAGGRGASAEAAATPARVAAMMAFLTRLEARCQPLPRQCQVATVIPFLEAVALAAPPGPAAQGAVREARAAHDRLMTLYGATQHLSDFIPILYYTERDGAAASPSSSSLASLQPKHTELKASQQRVHEFNVEDWMGCILFERRVARDLERAKTVAERARRFCLAPQRLLVQLNNAS